MYEFLAQLAQTFGLILFVLAFGLILAYALAPGNRSKFNRAASLPMDESDDDE